MRGLSCLYLLKEVMIRIKDLERSTAPHAMSSFDPIPCLNNANEPVPVDREGDATEKYLPCHYFGKSIGLRYQFLTKLFPQIIWLVQTQEGERSC